MDITSFVLGMKLGKGSGGGSTLGEGNTVSNVILTAGTNFPIQADGSAVIPHGLNSIPDIVLITRCSPVATGDLGVVNAIGYSKRFMNDTSFMDDGYMNKLTLIIEGGTATMGSSLSIDDGDGSGIFDQSRIRKANKKTVTFGTKTDTDFVYGVTKGEKYSIIAIGREDGGSEESISFADAPWSKIAEVSESGKAAEVFSIGDERIEDGFIYQIVGFNHDTLSDGSGTAGITVLCKATSYSRKMSDYGNAVDSWTNTTLYNKLNYISNGNTSDNVTLPADLVAVIKEVKKSYDYCKPTYQQIDTANFRLWIPSLKEITGTNPPHIELTDTQYEFFANSSDYKRYWYGSGNPIKYWTRTTYNGYYDGTSTSTKTWTVIGSDGSVEGAANGNYSNVIFGFCI